MPEPRWPEISVVTICRNAAGRIERTLRSVRAQAYPAIEHIVVDGASTDGTAEAVRQQAPWARLISEPDRGISDAFNKGIAASTGEWILMLNAGDAFIGDDALRVLAEATRSGRRLASARARCETKTIPRLSLQMRMGRLLRAHLSHQATLVHRQVYAEYGGYDEGFAIRMDFDFFLRVLEREPVAFVDRCVVEFEPGGVSGREFARHWEEGRRALAKNRCGALVRLQYEALFLALSAERSLRSA